jgi:probable HAF family extracellular repeat protein
MGQVVGVSTSKDGVHALITGPNGVGMTDLGALGGKDSLAFGINNIRQVLGIHNKPRRVPFFYHWAQWGGYDRP